MPRLDKAQERGRIMRQAKQMAGQYPGGWWLLPSISLGSCFWAMLGFALI